MPQYDHLTFPLAGAGYLLLGADFALRSGGRAFRALTVLLALVVLAHVALVWSDRFDWSLARMLQKSVAGFVLFHAALLLVLAAAVLPRRHGDRCILLAFPIVSAGALPAPFRYPEIGWLKAPLLALFALAVVAAVLAFRRRRARRA